MCGSKATIKHAYRITISEEHWEVFQRHIVEGLGRFGCEQIAVVPPVHPAATLREGHTHRGAIGVDGSHQNVLAQQIVECGRMEVIYQLQENIMAVSINNTISPTTSFLVTYCFHLQPLI